MNQEEKRNKIIKYEILSSELRSLTDRTNEVWEEREKIRREYKSLFKEDIGNYYFESK